MNLETLYIQIEAETSKIKSQVATVNKQFQGMENSLSKTFSNIAKAAVATFSVAAVVRYGKAIIDVVDNLKELNAQTGLSTQRIQELQYATGQTGGNFESVKKGIQTLNEQIAAGNPLFQQLGIDTSNTEVAFNQLLNVLADMPESSQKAVIGQQLLGRSFLELKPLLAEGSAGIAKLSRDANTTGAVMSDKLIAAIDNLGDSFATLVAAIKGAFIPVLEAIVPVIQKVVNWLIVAVGFITGFIQAMFGWKKSENEAAKANTTTTKTAVANAAKIKRAYAGFDELNVLPSDTGAATGVDTTTTTPTTTGTNVFEESLKGSEDIMKSFNAEIEKGRKFWEDYGQAIKVATGAIIGFWAAWTIGANIGIISTGITSAFETIITTLYVWWDDFFIWLSGLAGQTGWIGALTTSIWNFFTSVGAGISNLLGLKIVADGLAATMLGASAVILVVIGVFVALFQLFTDASDRAILFRQRLAESFAAIAETFNQVWTENIKPFFDEFMKGVMFLWNNGLKPFWDGFKALVGGIFETIVVIFSFVIRVVALFVGKLFNDLGPVILFIWDLIVSVGTFIFSFLGAFIEFFDGLIQFVVGLLTGDLKRAFGGVDTMVKSFTRGIMSFIIGIANVVIDLINLFIRLANAIKIDIPKWVPLIGGQKWSMNLQLIPKLELPKLAKGGILDAGSLFVAGEAGAELIGSYNNQTTVMPLQNSDFTAAMGQAVYGAMVNAMATQNTNNGPIIINVDGMTLAKSVETNLNKLSTLQGGLKIAL